MLKAKSKVNMAIKAATKQTKRVGRGVSKGQGARERVERGAVIVAAAVAVAIVGEVAREINAAADDESKLTLNCERATQLDAGAELKPELS